MMKKKIGPVVMSGIVAALLSWNCGATSQTESDQDLSHEAEGEDVQQEVEPEPGEELPPPFDWPTCERLTSEPSLADKAAHFDRVAREQHIAGDGLLRSIYLAEDMETIEYWRHEENTILWSGMYLASQALRHKVTGDPEALENARVVVAALHKLTLVTGVSGLYARSMHDPLVSYSYTAGPDNVGWTDSPAPGFEGWRYRNDVSQDGYAGLMFGYAAAMEHFDDQELLDDIRARLREIIDHIIGHGLQIFDADGEVTEHGRLYHTAWDNYPGFNAMMSSSWVKIAQTALDDDALDDFYYGCLMGMRDGVQCPDIEDEDLRTDDMETYIDSMENLLLLFLPSCQENYDNFDMCYQAMYPLLRREQDSGLKRRLVGVVRDGMFHTDNPRHQSLAPIGNSMFTFQYGALVGDGPEDDPVLADAIDRAICTLKLFPATKFEREIPVGAQEEVCSSRLSNPRAAEPIPLSEYYFDFYLWRLDFFEIVTQPREEDRRFIWSPEDYLIAYWLGRYHGFISDQL